MSCKLYTDVLNVNVVSIACIHKQIMLVLLIQVRILTVTQVTALTQRKYVWYSTFPKKRFVVIHSPNIKQQNVK